MTTKEQRQHLLATMETFNKACNFVSNYAFTNKVFNGIQIHKGTYREVRETFGLPSQMAIRVIGKVADSYVSHKHRVNKHEFKILGGIDYDDRNLTVKDGQVSISTVVKREKINYCSKKSLKEYDVCSQSEMTYDKVKNRFYINFVAKIPEAQTVKTAGSLGVDFGIVNLATCSDGTIYSGAKVESKRRQITSLKARLQAKGTKSAKRHLKKISKKECRYKKDVNHCISKSLVTKAKALGVSIKLEKLTHIRSKQPVMKFTKKQRNNNAKLGKWAFGQLRSFIEYKAKIAGIPVFLVNPAFTSRTCSTCGHCDQANRITQKDFVCQSCGYAANADYNASINISRASSISLLLSDVGLAKAGLTVAVATKV
jgi:putative transposase